MMEKEKWSGACGKKKWVDTESLVPQEHLLRRWTRVGRVPGN